MFISGFGSSDLDPNNFLKNPFFFCVDGGCKGSWYLGDGFALTLDFPTSEVSTLVAVLCNPELTLEPVLIFEIGFIILASAVLVFDNPTKKLGSLEAEVVDTEGGDLTLGLLAIEGDFNGDIGVAANKAELETLGIVEEVELVLGG